jgi:hypothetical protein
VFVQVSRGAFGFRHCLFLLVPTRAWRSFCLSILGNVGANSGWCPALLSRRRHPYPRAPGARAFRPYRRLHELPHDVESKAHCEEQNFTLSLPMRPPHTSTPTPASTKHKRTRASLVVAEGLEFPPPPVLLSETAYLRAKVQPTTLNPMETHQSTAMKWTT